MQKKCKNTLRANCPAKLMGPAQVQGGDAPGKDCHDANQCVQYSL